MTKARNCYSRFKRHSKATYRSGLEETLADFLRSRNIDGNYEAYKIEYVVPESNHTYTPDFVLPNGIIIESKGVWDSDDRKKHLLIKQQNPHLDIRFVFSRSKSKIYKGSKTTYADFCEKNGFKYADKEIPEEWLKEPKKEPKGLIKK